MGKVFLLGPMLVGGGFHQGGKGVQFLMCIYARGAPCLLAEGSTRVGKVFLMYT